jgi:hypothetical protein
LFTAEDIERISTEAHTNESLYLGGTYIEGEATATGITTIIEGKKLIITEGDVFDSFNE